MRGRIAKECVGRERLWLVLPLGWDRGVLTQRGHDPTPMLTTRCWATTDPIAEAAARSERT